MIEKVLKRDRKTTELFQPEKVRQAIIKAYQSCGETFDEGIVDCVLLRLDECGNEVSVEEIQDCIEKCLFENTFNVAIAFHDYRFTHKIIRDDKNALVKEYSKKLMAENVENQNANVDEYSFGGRMTEASDIFKKDFALNNLVSKQTKRNHINNESYIHDLNNYASGESNCLTLPFDKLLKNGAKIGQSDIRPAGGIHSAFQLVAVYFQIQSQEQFGGVSASHIDWTMVPYFRKTFTKRICDGAYYIERDERKKWLGEESLNLNKKDFKKYFKTWIENNDLFPDNLFHLDNGKFQKEHPNLWNYAYERTIEELEQAVEAMYHNLNTLQSRSGGQLPFTSINYGTCTLPEGRIIIKALLNGSINGIGKHHLTPIFPCSIFQLAKGINRKPGDPNYDLFMLALKSTAKRIYPNYANVDWSGNKGYDKNNPETYFSTMGCRTANGWDINGLGQQKDGRGNICPQTIILPTLAMQALEDEDVENLKKGIISGDKEKKIDKFMRILSRKIDQTKDSLIDRFDWIASQSPKSAPFMWTNHTMAGYIPEEGIRSALKHGTLAIGQLALPETLQILIGKNQTTEEGMELAKRIERLFRKKCADFKEEYKLNFGVYYTPAENLCYTAMNKFKAKYGIIPNVSDREYFTNSIHVPVWEKMTPFEKIDTESQLTGYSSAGCITYVELDSSVTNNIESLETLVNYAMDKDIPYFAINIPIDNCRDCGYSGDFDGNCPVCNSDKIDRLRRVTGYLSSDYRRFNNGKQKEVDDRVVHEENILI